MSGGNRLTVDAIVSDDSVAGDDVVGGDASSGFDCGFSRLEKSTADAGGGM
jgi:hypothetical protein